GRRAGGRGAGRARGRGRGRPVAGQGGDGGQRKRGADDEDPDEGAAAGGGGCGGAGGSGGGDTGGVLIRGRHGATVRMPWSAAHRPVAGFRLVRTTEAAGGPLPRPAENAVGRAAGIGGSGGPVSEDGGLLRGRGDGAIR